MTRAKSKKPAKVVVHPVHAMAERGPHKDGSGRWYWRARVFQGERGGHRTIWTDWALPHEVAPLLNKLIYEQGIEKKPEPENEGGPLDTILDLMETWVAQQEKRLTKSESWRRSAKRSGKRLAQTIGMVHVDRVDGQTLARYRDQRLRSDGNPTGIASATVKQDLKMLRAAWRWARELRYIPNVELPRVKLEVVGVREKRTPSRDEVLRVFEHLDDAWPRLAVLLLFATGARIAEVAKLTWGDVDLVERLVTFRRTKNGKDREVPIHRQVVDALRQWKPRRTDPGTGELVDVPATEGIFGVTWKMVRSHLGTKYLRRACIAAKVPHFTPHGLRRAAVRAFRRGGIGAKTAASFLGHSEVVMLRFYDEADAEDHRKAVAVTRLGAIFPDEDEDVIEGPWTAPAADGENR